MDIKRFDNVKMFVRELEKLGSPVIRQAGGDSGGDFITEQALKLMNMNQHLINRYAGLDSDLNQSLTNLARRLTCEMHASSLRGKQL